MARLHGPLPRPGPWRGARRERRRGALFATAMWALGAGDGQAIVIHPARTTSLIVGYRCQLSIATPMAQWPALKRVHVEKGVWERGAWVSQGDYAYGVDQSRSTIGVGLSRAGRGVRALVTCGPFVASGSSRQKKNTDKNRWGG